MGSRRSLHELNPMDVLNPDRHMLGPEDPAHKVEIDAFYMDKYETTNAEYKEYLEEKKVAAPEFWDQKDFNQPNQPVVGVTWKNATNYCLWKGKRLPTEAEWEKASRGKRQIEYPWGNEKPDKSRLNFNNESGKSMPVGSFENGKSDYGVYDLAGNVSEWVYDWHMPEFYMFSPKKNPQGPKKRQYKVVRGGHWKSDAQDVRMTYRNASVPKLKSDFLGFRCARNVEN